MVFGDKRILSPKLFISNTLSTLSDEIFVSLLLQIIRDRSSFVTIVKVVNTVPEIVPVWPKEWNILIPINTGVPFRDYRYNQYWCTVSSNTYIAGKYINKHSKVYLFFPFLTYGIKGKKLKVVWNSQPLTWIVSWHIKLKAEWKTFITKRKWKRGGQNRKGKKKQLLRSNPKKKKKSKGRISTTWGTTGDNNIVAYLMLVSVVFSFFLFFFFFF